MATLDLGCGPGYATRALASDSAPAVVVGVDHSSRVLKAAQEQEPMANLSFLQADLLDIPLESNTFDYAWSHLVLQHLPDPATALQEARRLVRPAGRVVVVEPVQPSPVAHPPLPALEALWAAVEERQRAAGGDPGLGDRLELLLQSQGLALEKVMVWARIARGIHLVEFNSAAYSRGLLANVDERLLEDASQALEEWRRQPGAEVCIDLKVVIGSVP